MVGYWWWQWMMRVMMKPFFSMINILWFKICSYVASAFGSFICSFFPILNPQKQMANIGVTPTIGAAIPLYRPKKPCEQAEYEWETYICCNYIVSTVSIELLCMSGKPTAQSYNTCTSVWWRYGIKDINSTNRSPQKHSWRVNYQHINTTSVGWCISECNLPHFW